MGRKVDLEALQRVQNMAMLWIGGEDRRAFRIDAALDRIGWLDICEGLDNVSTESDQRRVDDKLVGENSEN